MKTGHRYCYTIVFSSLASDESLIGRIGQIAQIATWIRGRQVHHRPPCLSTTHMLVENIIHRFHKNRNLSFEKRYIIFGLYELILG